MSTSEQLLTRALLAKEEADRTLLAPHGLYICMNCGIVNDYFRWECQECEADGERQFEEGRGN